MLKMPKRRMGPGTERVKKETAMERRLAAILAADMVAYSRHMEADEAGTLDRLRALRADLIDPKIEQHRGRIVKTTGDGILVEFVSVVDALETAVEIQREMSDRNGNVSDDRRVEFRIGVNLGEIIIEDNDIYGTGVNIAARLETMAEPGGICISHNVYEQIQTTLNLNFRDMGDQQVKNIARPIHSYSIDLSDGAVSPRAAPPVATPVVEKTENPSIAVLPFDNMSADPEQEYFADGISEDIITALSKISGLFVIARNSTFTYKGKAVDVRQISSDLGVRYVLEGSVRKSGNRVRITGQLVDARTGDHVWAARFDRELDDLFAVQDEITSNVVTALHVRLVEGEQARAWHKSTENLAAWDCLVQGLGHFRNFTNEENALARGLFETAVRLDPNYAVGWVWLAWTHWSAARFLWTDAPGDEVAEAADIADKALGLNPDLAEAHSLRGGIHLMQREFDEAIASGEKAIALEPNSADITALQAMTLNWSDRAVESLSLIDKAMRLSPLYSAWYLAVKAHAYRLMQRYEEAATTYRDSITRNPNHIGPHIGLTACYAEAGELDRARAQAAKLLNLNPGFTLTKYSESLTYRDPAQSARALSALRGAGLPE